ncbi:MAG: M28 family peptidase, partial [Cytophagaceae bacterium]|nr:M28 family peptidase [Gemmatimonadaceae bacterium]
MRPADHARAMEGSGATPRTGMGVRWRLALLGTLGALSGVGAQDTRLGYAPASWAREDRVEERFRSLVIADSISALHRPLAARPHPSGSAGSREVVGYLERTLRGFGLDVTTHDYEVWLSEPRRVQVTMTGPTPRAISVREPPIAGDPSSSHPDLGDGWVAYSGSGDVTAEVVYVNYGLPADYAELSSRGVTVAGRVALARYGRSHRAVKVHTAQGAGARALLLYSDPADDGAMRGPAWPEGYWRGPDMLQRGNAKMSWFFHGDPLTPGTPALPGATRLDPLTAPTLPRIPVVPLAWNEARHLLSALGGIEAPSAFRGALAAATRLGPGPARVRVDVQMHDTLRTITNVVATLRGVSQADRVVMLGGHHDAWTFGGVDPGTGAAALLEVARTLGTLAREGMRPARSIALAFWDAEEFGLTGSTEYVEQFRKTLQEELLLYVNTDMYMRGRFDPGGVPSLSAFVADVVKDVPDGASTVYDAWQASEWKRLPAARKQGDVSAFVPDLKPLGSGADFVPFQDHLGVPTMAIEFIGDNGYGYGTYHTNYDSRAYVEKIADPGFAQGVLMSRVLGTMALRMSQADVLPFRFSHYGTKLREAIASAEGWATEAGVAIDVAPLRTRAAAVAKASASLETALDAR